MSHDHLGSVNRYQCGCRCDDCRMAARDAQRRHRKRNLLIADPLDISWMDGAPCIGKTKTFFPVRGESSAPAKKICREQCAHTEECLEYAILTSQRVGVWGGTSERQRREMKRVRLAP